MIKNLYLTLTLVFIGSIFGLQAEADGYTPRGHHRSHFGHHHRRSWHGYYRFHHAGGFARRHHVRHGGRPHFHFGHHRRHASLATGGAAHGLQPTRSVASGLASWYSGRRTADGERFNGGALTAAHRFYPFGTRVLVTNQSSGRSVVVRINDRGPFVRGRVIDLSRSAAQAVGISGVGRVSLQRL